MNWLRSHVDTETLVAACRTLLLLVASVACFVAALRMWLPDTGSTTTTSSSGVTDSETTSESISTVPALPSPIVNPSGTPSATAPGPTGTPKASTTPGTSHTDQKSDSTVTIEDSGSRRSETVAVALLGLGALFVLLAVFGDRIESIKGGGLELVLRDINRQARRRKVGASPDVQAAVETAKREALMRAILLFFREASDGS